MDGMMQPLCSSPALETQSGGQGILEDLSVGVRTDKFNEFQ